MEKTEKQKLTKLILIGITSLFFYLWLFLYLSFWINSKNLSGDKAVFMWATGIVFLYGLFILLRPGKEFIKIGIIFATLFLLILFLTTPLETSRDIYYYALQAKTFTVHGMNPYVVAPLDLPPEELDGLISEYARSRPTVYGPAWTIISMAPVYFFPENILELTYSYKTISLIFTLLGALMIYKILGIIRPQSKHAGALIYLWNPFLIFELAIGAHNDAFMIFWLLFSIYLVLKKKYFWAMPVFFLSVLVKYQTFLIFPLFFIFIWNQATQRKEKLKVYLSVFLSAVMCVVFYYPFWEGFKIFVPMIKSQIEQISIHSFLPYAMAGIFTANPTIFIAPLSFIFFIIYLALIYCFYKKPTSENFFIFGTYSLVTFYLINSIWLMPWYFLLPLMLVILLADKKKYQILLICLTAVLALETIVNPTRFFICLIAVYFVTRLVSKRQSQSF